MINAQSGSPVEIESLSLDQNMVYLKVVSDFSDRIDVANFFFSLDGLTWTEIGSPLKMEYTLPHFMGFRFGLFNYSTKEAEAFVDFDWFRIN